MSIVEEKEFKKYEDMISYIVRDDDTDEIIGLRDDAPAKYKKLFDQYMKEVYGTDSDEPVMK